MRLQTILDSLNLTLVHGDGDVTLTDLTDDSRRIEPGWLFVDRGGKSPEGKPFVLDAVEHGAAAVISVHGFDRSLSKGVGLATALPGVNVDQAFAGRVAGVYLGHPASKLRLVAVTGTNGKTTTAFIVQALLNRLDTKTGMIGTVFTDVGDPTGPAAADLTTPGAIDVHRLLARMVDNGCAAAVMETSSHALHQGRTAGLDFAAAVFTNFSQDHLDYHITMDAYADAKAILFEKLSPDAWAIVNADDPAAQRMVRDTRAKVFKTNVLLSLPPGEGRGEGGPNQRAALKRATDHTSPHPNPLPKGEGAGVSRAVIGNLSAFGSDVTFTGPWGSFDVTLPLVGRYNVCNALQAVTVAAVMTDAPGKVLREALAECPSVPGRLERVSVMSDGNTGSASTPNIPTILVDYAHTDDALRNVLDALRPLTTGKLIVVVGCGGDRDKTKRPKMARVAVTTADRVVITSDNPRTEDPEAIIADMLEGVSGLGAGVWDRSSDETPDPSPETRVTVIADRAAAIARAIADAGPADTVLLAGKGHEDYQVIGKDKRHFDDREHAAVALRKWEADRR